ncbi:hypothetical protein [Fluviicola sp.]|uniref:hypothetical protein n=1 Tax=Fluviicola sp. TaxID=1917219 RepID=UPI0026142BD4|nr:hypothetical protein [Fluviicola sp.]
MKKGLIFLAITFFAFTSCKKKEVIKTNTVEVEAAPSLTGNWEGYYGGRTVSPSGDTSFYSPGYGYSMILKSNGTANVYNTLLADSTNGSTATGTWVYSTNNTIVVNYTYGPGESYFVRAAVDSKMHAINGKWYNSNGSVGGLFYLAKK